MSLAEVSINLNKNAPISAPAGKTVEIDGNSVKSAEIDGIAESKQNATNDVTGAWVTKKVNNADNAFVWAGASRETPNAEGKYKNASVKCAINGNKAEVEINATSFEGESPVHITGYPVNVDCDYMNIDPAYWIKINNVPFNYKRYAINAGASKKFEPNDGIGRGLMIINGGTTRGLYIVYLGASTPSNLVATEIFKGSGYTLTRGTGYFTIQNTSSYQCVVTFILENGDII